LVAGENCGHHIIGRGRWRPIHECERRRYDNPSWRGHRRQMNIIDLAQSGECATRAEIDSGRIVAARQHGRPVTQHRLAFGSRGARDPGGDAVKKMKLDQLAYAVSQWLTPDISNEPAQLLECGHWPSATGVDHSTSQP